MFGGKIKRKEGKTVEGSYRQNAWDDTCEIAYPIEYNGELTPEVCQAIMKAWNATIYAKPTSSWGALRWSAGNYANRVDVEKRMLITTSVTRLCD